MVKEFRNAWINRSGSDCSLVARVLCFSRFHWPHSHSAGNRNRDAPRTSFQRQISHRVKGCPCEGASSICSYRKLSRESTQVVGNRVPCVFAEVGIQGLASPKWRVSQASSQTVF